MAKARPSRITPEVLEREAEVLRLRRGGLTFDLIAKQLNYSHASGAHKAYVNACRRIISTEVADLRQVEIDRLDMAQASIWAQVLNGDLQAINTLVRLVSERAKLLGLYAPAKVEASVTQYTGGGDIDAEVARLAAILAANADAEGGSGEALVEP